MLWDDPTVGPFHRVGVVLFMGLWALAAGGLLWSPIGAAICGGVARVRGIENPLQYTSLGAVYSIMLLMPWFYLLLRLCNVRVPRAVVALAYLVLYLALLGMVDFYVLYSYEGVFSIFFDPEAMRITKSPYTNHVIGAVLSVGFIMLVAYLNGKSLCRLLRHLSRLRTEPEAANWDAQQGPNPYRSPFSSAWISLVIFPLLWVALLILHLPYQ